MEMKLTKTEEKFVQQLSKIIESSILLCFRSDKPVVEGRLCWWNRLILFINDATHLTEIALKQVCGKYGPHIRSEMKNYYQYRVWLDDR